MKKLVDESRPESVLSIIVLIDVPRSNPGIEAKAEAARDNIRDPDVVRAIRADIMAAATRRNAAIARKKLARLSQEISAFKYDQEHMSCSHRDCSIAGSASLATIEKLEANANVVLIDRTASYTK